MISKKNLLRLFSDIYQIRKVEELLADEYRKGIMKTPTHFGIGQEAIAVGVCLNLIKNDPVFTHHRSHTHYLACGGSIYGLMSELLGRVDGCSMGRGGSVHITQKDKGFYGSSPILGHSAALAVGAAFGINYNNKKNISVGFFGEGAFDEGSVWESINYAAIKKLPVLFVCEDNLYATESPLSVRLPKNINFIDKVKSFGVDVIEVDGNDVVDVYEKSKKIIKKVKSLSKPYLIYAYTYRWREHVGPMWDYELNRTYRTKEELNKWMKKCPVLRMEKLLLQNIIPKNTLDEIKINISKNVNEIFEKSLKSDWPNPKDLFINSGP
jgi:TPP-dependent pyruvate/acetoin dehydrogenase alpha subunit